MQTQQKEQDAVSKEQEDSKVDSQNVLQRPDTNDNLTNTQKSIEKEGL